MWSSGQNSRKVKFYLISSMVMILMAVFSGRYYQQSVDLQKTINDLQKKINQKDQKILSELENLQRFYENNSDSVFFLLNLYELTFKENGFAFFIFESDSLVFWTENSVPVDFVNNALSDHIVFSGNAFYRLSQKKTGTTQYLGVYLIKFNYSYQNKYLENEFHPSFGFPCSAEISIDKESGSSVYSEEGDYLFSIDLSQKCLLSNHQLFMLFVFYLLALLFFIGFIYEIYLRIFSGRGKNLLFLTAFIFDIILIRVVLFYFKIPNILYNSSFFGPHYYAHSELIPSLGDLFINMIFLLLIAFFVFYHYKFSWKITRRKPFFRYFFSFSLMLHFFIFFNGLIFIYDSLINDSIVSVNLNNIFSLSWMSMLSFLIISISILTYLLITSKMAFMAFKAAGRISTYAILALSVLAVWAVFCSFYGKCNWVYISFVLLYILSFGGFFHIGKWKFNLSIIVFYILMFSLITTYALHTYNNEKEREHRKFLALYLASDQRDPVAEYLFDKNVNIILSDSIINYFIYTNTSQSNNLDSVEKYLSRVYFSDYWRKYDHQITVCNSVDFLIVKPDEKELECWAFFENMIRNSGKATQNPYLYFLNFGPADYGYIAVLEYNNKLPESLPIRIFVELTPKYVARDLGFPELLIDREIIRSPDLSEYSYAKYQHGELQQRVGKYFYNFTLASYLPNEVKNSFIDQNNYNHFIYHIDESRDLIISKKNKTILDVIAPFSYLFLFYALFSGIIFTFFILPFSYHKISFNFRTRLQLSMSAVILFSFLVIGIFTLFYIQNLNAQKNNDILSEKTHSILVEMQHKLFNEEQIDEYLTPYVGDLLVKFSNVFFTDINLFNLDGKLIASSRKQIYDEKLIGTQMNPRAYKELSMKSSSLFIQNENIGKQDYLSAYIPFVNERNKVIAYLNLPYFAKENDLKREISTFLVAYINIYVILIAISIIIALIISNYVSRPIKLIMGKIAGLNLGGKNEKIEWRHADEIGQLVNAYNRMVDELAISAELLARSERESAWREMAKQVAHEIKNPLTPMKLSVQHLQRAWTQDSPNWAGRLDKFTQTMIEQIDALSIIATEFSDFAKMPATRKQAVNVVDIMQTTINLFRNYVNITITLSFSEEQVIVFADKDQLLRAFNNLIKNAVQAIGRKSSGTINVEVKKENQQCIIKVSDNGMGISPELTEKIFSPYFTTKTSGMGLGLAIVKSIIANSDGQISFESKQGSGTVFTISLPFIENSLYV